ncbi:hypothetical protein U9R90_33380, partial [Streptomyces sp. E11-3]|uniref:hypothetical protein n=1 Tax=Streptomyces sp. E11-3 TaxID=3110112 RepID=UPI0039810D3B
PTPTPTALPQPDSRILTRWAAWGLGLLLPTVIASWFLVLSTEQGSACLMRGGCNTPPAAAYWGPFWAALVLGVAALCWTRKGPQRLRAGVVVTQWAAQLTLAAVILSYGS